MQGLQLIFIAWFSTIIFNIEKGGGRNLEVEKQLSDPLGVFSVQRVSVWEKLTLSVVSAQYDAGEFLVWNSSLNPTVRWEYLPFRATAAGPRCCFLTASRSLCRCISSAGPRHFCRETVRLSRCHHSWRSWAPSAPDPPHGPGQERTDGWRPESLHISLSSYIWL